MSTQIHKRLTVRLMTEGSAEAMDGKNVRPLAIIVGKITGGVRERAYSSFEGSFQMTLWNGAISYATRCDLPNIVAGIVVSDDARFPLNFIMRLIGKRTPRGIEYEFQPVKG